MDILIATSNPGKADELRRLLAPLHAELHTLEEFPGVPDVVEDALTFEENAIAKAQHYCARTGLATIADDGGLEIDVFGGWPGVHSRRIFGDGRRATDEELITEVLRRMQGIPLDQRGARMRSVVAYGAPDGAWYTGEGEDRGMIAEQAALMRIPGFPFRSLFFHPERGMTTVEAVLRGVSMDDAMTHRKKAVARVLPKIVHWRSQQKLVA